MIHLFQLLRGVVLDFAFAGLALLCCLSACASFSRRVQALRVWMLPRVTRLALGVLMLAAVFAVAKQGGTNGTDRPGAPARTVRRVAAEAGLTDGIVARRIRGQLGSAREDGVNVFFIPGRGEKLRRKWREPIGTTESPKCMIIIRESASGASLAHEIGHCCGLCDIYVERASDRSTSADRVVIRNFMEDDWNNGTGCRFYPTGLSMEFLSKRLLMYGVGGEAAFDIPLGPIEGMAKDKGQGKLNVGQSKGVFTRLPRSR